MSEQFKFTKKRTIWLVILCVLLILANLYQLFTAEDLTSFRSLRFVILCLAFGYAIYFFIKKYKESK